jgi:N6-L-threonylcarbamoyladenine synthase
MPSPHPGAGPEKARRRRGVSANRCLRDTLQRRSQAAGLDFLCPPFEFCTDNAAMIASAGFYAFQNGRRDNLDLNATATLELV